MRNEHITPNNDLYPHVQHFGCPCGPTIEAVYSVVGGRSRMTKRLVVHNAWDRREYAEGEWNLPTVPWVARTEVM